MQHLKLFFCRSSRLIRIVAPLAAILAALFIPKLHAQNANTRPSIQPHPTHYSRSRFPKRAEMYYESVWGIDSLTVKAVESGELIRFSYRILDPSKATVFNDKRLEAFLESPKAHARLVIPTLEKVGQLRQYNNPESGKSYWMGFSNPHLTVKRGDTVNIVIGRFHASGLRVQ